MAGKAQKRAERPCPLMEPLTGEEAAAAFLRGEVLMIAVEECIRKFGLDLVQSLVVGDLVAYEHVEEEVPFVRSDVLQAWMLAHPDNEAVARYMAQSRVLH